MDADSLLFIHKWINELTNCFSHQKKTSVLNLGTGLIGPYRSSRGQDEYDVASLAAVDSPVLWPLQAGDADMTSLQAPHIGAESTETIIYCESLVYKWVILLLLLQWKNILCFSPVQSNEPSNYQDGKIHLLTWKLKELVKKAPFQKKYYRR